ncbi:hypothetical protein [Nocardia sp. NPDC051463]|uniref:hypothetical protein n=1 Tax=Nocardia sp. NPDC051463 TaxID=3154845 RepID=UPI00344D8874
MTTDDTTAIRALIERSQDAWNRGDGTAYGADTAVVLTRGESSKGEPKKLGKLATYIVVRDTCGWRIAAVQKTQHKPLMEAISFTFQPATRPAAR